jgi:hypothetical protein
MGSAGRHTQRSGAVSANARLVRTAVIAVVLAVAAALLAFGGLWAAGVFESDSPYLVERPSPAEERATSLNEAWDLAWAEATNWRSDAQLVELGAFGAYEPADIEAGADGRRRYWLARFVARDATLFVQIIDGRAVRGMEQEGGVEEGEARAITVKPAVDSTDFVPLALAGRSGFAGSTGDVNGVGLSLSVEDDGRTVVTVRGRYQERDAIAKVDPSTGSILSWERLAPGSEGGLLYSRDAGATWQASDLVGKLVVDVAPMPGSDGIGYALVENISRMELFETADGGASWSPIGALPEEAGPNGFAVVAVRFEGQDILVVSGKSGVWSSLDGGVSWEPATGVVPGPAVWLAVAQDGEQIRLFADAGGAGNARLFSSSDGRTWTQLLAGSYRLAESYDHRQALAIPNIALPNPIARVLSVNPANDGASLTFNSDVSDAVGAFDGSAALISFSPDKIRFTDDGGATWRTTREGELTGVVASPVFASTLTLLAATYEGLLRSENGGATWEPTLSAEEVRALAPGGDGAVYRMAFLSADGVVAIENGKRSWQPF